MFGELVGKVFRTEGRIYVQPAFPSLSRSGTLPSSFYGISQSTHMKTSYGTTLLGKSSNLAISSANRTDVAVYMEGQFPHPSLPPIFKVHTS